MDTCNVLNLVDDSVHALDVGLTAAETLEFDVQNCLLLTTKKQHIYTHLNSNNFLYINDIVLFLQVYKSEDTDLVIKCSTPSSEHN